MRRRKLAHHLSHVREDLNRFDARIQRKVRLHNVRTRHGDEFAIFLLVKGELYDGKWFQCCPEPALHLARALGDRAYQAGAACQAENYSIRLSQIVAAKDDRICGYQGHRCVKSEKLSERGEIKVPSQE